MTSSFLKSCKIPDRINVRMSQAYYGSRIYKFEPFNEKDGELAPYIENIPYNTFEFSPKREIIMDPRGFDLKMVRGNVMFLLSSALMSNGRICEPCRYVMQNLHSYWLVPTRLIHHD